MANSVRGIVWDTSLNDGEFRRRGIGERVAGVSFLLPIQTNTIGTTQSTPHETGNAIWEPEEFDVNELHWRSFVSQSGGVGTGILQLWNYTNNAEIDRLIINAGSNYAYHSRLIALPSIGPVRLIGTRLWRASGGGSVISHVSSFRVREN